MKYIIQTTELDQDNELHLKYLEVNEHEFLVKYLHDPEIIYWQITNDTANK